MEYCRSSNSTGCLVSSKQHFQYVRGFIKNLHSFFAAWCFPSSLRQSESVCGGRGHWLVLQIHGLTPSASDANTISQPPSDASADISLPALIISVYQTSSPLIGQRTNLVYHQHSYTQSRRRCNYAAG